jgi:VWFA-related protein
MRRAFSVTLAMTAVIAGVATAPATTRALTQPTLKSETRYVEVDVRVTDKHGAFVSTLTKNDFQVQEDKHVRPVAILELVDLTKAAVEPPRAPRRARRYVMVLDDLLIPTAVTPTVRRLARQFIQQNLDAGDDLSIVRTSAGIQKNTWSMADQAARLRAVDEYAARGGDSRAADNSIDSDERAQYALKTLATLQDVVRSAPIRSGRRTSILLFSSGTDYDASDFRKYRRGPDIMEAMREAVWLALRDNVTVYTIDPRGVTSPLFQEEDADPVDADSNDLSAPPGLPASRIRVQGALSAFATQTGGFAVVNRDNFDTAFKDIVRDNSTYYLVGFCAATSEPDGKTHHIEVKVTGSGLSVRSRREYSAPARGRAAATAAHAASTPCPG